MSEQDVQNNEVQTGEDVVEEAQEQVEVGGEDTPNVEDLQKEIQTLHAKYTRLRNKHKKTKTESKDEPQYNEDRIETMLDLRQKYPTLTGDTRKKVMELMDREGITSIDSLEKDPILSPFLEKIQQEARGARAFPPNSGRQGNSKTHRFDDLSFEQVEALSSEEYAEYKKYHSK